MLLLHIISKDKSLVNTTNKAQKSPTLTQYEGPYMQNILCIVQK